MLSRSELGHECVTALGGGGLLCRGFDYRWAEAQTAEASCACGLGCGGVHQRCIQATD